MPCEFKTPNDFDPSQAKWAVDAAKFPADKESSWPYPPEKDGWMHAHNSIRCEVDEFTKALAATAERLKGSSPAEWEVSSIKLWWKSHYDHVHSHHTNEDDGFVPFFEERINFPSKCNADHQVLTDHFTKIGKLVEELSTESTTAVPNLAKAWNEYSVDLKHHLKEEETVAIPLMCAFFKQEEVAPKVQEIMGSETAPKEEMGAFIYWMGEERFRGEFMQQEGIPFFVWWIGGFESKFQFYRDQVQAQVEALKAGKPAVQKMDGCAIM